MNMVRFNNRCIYFVPAFCLFMVIYFYCSIPKADEMSGEAVEVHSWEELKEAVDEASQLIILGNDITCKTYDSPLKIQNSYVHIDLNGYTIYKECNGPLLQIIGNPVCSSSLKEELNIEPLQFPEDYILHYNDLIEEDGEIIYIEDDLCGEFNGIKQFVDDETLLLTKRPINIYKRNAKIFVFEDVPSHIIIENGKIVNNSSELGSEYSAAQEILDISSGKALSNVYGIIEIRYAQDVEIRHIDFVNYNTGEDTIKINQSELVSVDSCSLYGGKTGIRVYEGASQFSLCNNIIYDCSAAIFLGGNKGSIVNNKIIQSGNTLKNGDGITITASAKDNIISQNEIIGGMCYGIWGLSGNTGGGNSIINNLIDSNITYGIYIESGQGYIIQENRVQRCSGGICVDSCKDFVISDNIAKDNLVSGISIGEKVENTIVENNICQGNNYVDPNIAGYGGNIVIWGYPKNLIIENNVGEITNMK